MTGTPGDVLGTRVRIRHLGPCRLGTPGTRGDGFFGAITSFEALFLSSLSNKTYT